MGYQTRHLEVFSGYGRAEAQEFVAPTFIPDKGEADMGASILFL